MTVDVKLKGGWPEMNRDPKPKVEKIEKPKWGWASNQRGQLVITLNIAGAVLHLSLMLRLKFCKTGLTILTTCQRKGTSDV